MFEEFEFNPGTVTYNPSKLSPNDMTDIKWLSEVFKQEYSSVTELYEGMSIAIQRVKLLSKQ